MTKSCSIVKKLFAGYTNLGVPVRVDSWLVPGGMKELRVDNVEKVGDREVAAVVWQLVTTGYSLQFARIDRIDQLQGDQKIMLVAAIGLQHDRFI